MMFLQTLAMARPPAEGEEAVSPINTLVMIGFMVAIFYFLLIRPQQRREKERKALIAAVKSGERVLLASGIIGDVRTVKDKTLIVRIAKDTEVEVVKSAVSQIIEKGADPVEVKA
jgi:preprotein translocase subunit YajC